MPLIQELCQPLHLGYALVSLTRHSELPPGSGPFGGLVLAFRPQAADITYQVGDPQ